MGNPVSGSPAQPAVSVPQLAGNATSSGTWTSIESINPYPGVSPTTGLMLTDGSVIILDQCTPNWYRLIPNPANGRYVTGSWTAYAPADRKHIAAMPGGYAPLYFASQVMRDTRVIVQGGEYDNSINGCNGAVWSNKGAVYNPYFDAWSVLPPPAGWNNIGDAASVLLGSPISGYMLADPVGNCTNLPSFCTNLNQPLQKEQAVLTALTPAASVAPPTTITPTWQIVGHGKFDGNDEEGWVLLPNGNVLTVDTGVYYGPLQVPNTSEQFNPFLKFWSSAGTIPVQLVEPTSHEIGPAVLTFYGIVFQAGAYTGSTPNTEPGHTALYRPEHGWTRGPDFPKIGGVYEANADGPAALLVNTNVLIQTSAQFTSGNSQGESTFPSSFLEYNGGAFGLSGTLFQVNNPNSAPNVASYQGRMLELPTGQILWSSDGRSGPTAPLPCTGFNTPAGCNVDIAVYTPVGNLDFLQRLIWAPFIFEISSTKLVRGTTNHTVRGVRLYGVSQGSGYGDDVQQFTNYPLVQITNNATGRVCFARTHGSNPFPFGDDVSMFDIPPAVTPDAGAGWPLYENPCVLGASTLLVITNGIPSNPIPVTIQ
jgi:hypothetical protein